MENNWLDRVKEIINNNCTNHGNSVVDLYEFEEVAEAALIAMNLVFEATKKECADKSEVVNPKINWTKVDKESILNINKPNL